MFQQFELASGVKLFVRPTEQFKTINISFKWKQPLTVEKASIRAVLANILQFSNEVYPTNAAFRKRLDDLYGTALYFDTTKKGSHHIFSLNAETVNDAYLSNEKIVDEVFSLLHTVIFKPNLENGKFGESIVKREKEQVIERIQSMYDDKTRYAQQRLLENIRPNNPASITSNGTVETVKAITNEQLIEMHHDLLTKDDLSIYVVGDVNIQEIKEKMQSHFSFVDRTEKIEKPVDIPSETTDKKFLHEIQDMKQGKLHIAYQTPITFFSEEFPVMQLTNGILGGFSHSKIFMNVREKESMAYYASSSYSSLYGLIFVLAGIDSNLQKKAVALIDEQLKVMQAGDISDLELNQTKSMLTNQLKEALDSARAQIEIYDQYKELNASFTVEDWVGKWMNVTKEQIQQMALTIEKEFVYFLSGKEGAANE
ncbi:EF-P 5-aminopentanol modification-associated protein YfmF [Psychrobacillus psychrodurans]|uniref:EF-P 5-aminopentanol modification-associated protein YfmF n=1 Tax=Psychrobacillus psychrodurans TaxID=126157 RepID=UPI0008EC4A4C|nr:pitrilysin family protein [Psychrobacillus psychrodurans]MCZ8539598.1 insulinase family protein [Psychrobacillus psychrodurans]SFM42497.1 Predicted Zn-dependent peptidase [Psychrobacillus psychrodurans]